jgi:hypothetical protein
VGAKEGIDPWNILQKYAAKENARKAYHKMDIIGNLKMSLEFIGSASMRLVQRYSGWVATVNT